MDRFGFSVAVPDLCRSVAKFRDDEHILTIDEVEI